MRNITTKIIPMARQRYETSGDYWSRWLTRRYPSRRVRVA